MWQSDEGARAKITLKKSGSFDYSYKDGLYLRYSSGTWNVSSDTLILTSQLQEAKSNYEIIDVEMEVEDSMNVHVIDSDHRPIPFVNCRLKIGSQALMESITDLNGTAVLTRQKKTATLHLSMTGMKKIEINITPGVSTLTVEMQDDFWNYRYFNSEKWIFSSTRLYDPHLKTISNSIDSGFYELDN